MPAFHPSRTLRSPSPKGASGPDWIEWIGAQGEKKVPAKGARVPGKGKLKAIEDESASYVRGR